MPFIAALYRYPGKSMHGENLQSLMMTARGVIGDRVVMLVHPQTGQFITARSPGYRKMLQINALWHGDSVALSAQGMDNYTVFLFDSGHRPHRSIKIFTEDGEAIVDTEVSHWCSKFIGKPVELVFLPPDVRRFSGEGEADNTSQLTFADKFTLLGFSQASLSTVRHRLDEQIHPEAFRPNLVFGGSHLEAFVEETPSWSRLQIGEVILEGVRSSQRCVIPTLDPQTGEQVHPHLRTAIIEARADFPHAMPGYFFGMNYNVLQTGTIRVGDTVELMG